jgi:predicted transcriptional regulator
MKRPVPHRTLSRRERQMMDILYQLGRATAGEIHERLADPPSYSAVRAKLRVLEEKGHIRHEVQAARYIYVPVIARDRAKESALRHLLTTFFDNSAEQAMTALIELRPGEFSREKLDHLAALIAQAKKEGHK